MKITETINATQDSKDEKLFLLGKFLEEEGGYEIDLLFDNAIKVSDSRGGFLITNCEGTKICICADNKLVDLVAPDSFQEILKTIEYCKETWQDDLQDRCQHCPQSTR